MLVNNINKYDGKFMNEIQEVFKRLQERAKGDLEYLR